MPERRATYRLQLHAGFGFDAAAALAEGLSDLGISHVYCSPYLQAARGSTHGYDVVDPTRVSEDLGGVEAHRRFTAALRGHGLSQVLDIVPNHMSVDDPRNTWWRDLLTDGRQSPFAPWFDIDWENSDPFFSGKLLLPVLGDHVGRVIAAGELRLERRGGTVEVAYFDRTLPLDPTGLALVLGAAAVAAGEGTRLGDVVRELNTLPVAAPGDDAAARERRDRRLAVGAALEPLLADGSPEAAAVDAELTRVNGDVAAFDALLSSQHYRLALWKTALHGQNYRRFFDVTALAALRTEVEEVFLATHELVARLVRDGVLDGVRADHVDGLRDPGEYARRLRRLVGPETWVLVEKILEDGETLDAGWPVDGTTGYDVLALVNGLFVDPAGEVPLTALWTEVSGDPRGFDEVAQECKRLVSDTVLAPDVDRLGRLLQAVCVRYPEHRDHAPGDIREVLVAYIAALPVYRTYLVPARRELGPHDVERITATIAAVRGSTTVDDSLLSLLEDILLRRVRQPAIMGVEAGEDPATELVVRLQQVGSAVMAKGVEDTAFYRYHRLVSLNEVGGSPATWGTSVDAFHADNRRAQQQHPQRMVATSTHDTKRSEDVRARISLLSEIPDEWEQTVRRWSALNARHRGAVDRATEYLLYQTLVGAHPLSADRAIQYMEKATREAKLRTSWIEPDAEFDEALRGFIEAIVGDELFAGDLERFCTPLVAAGRVSSLAQVLLRCTVPGVPDTYQGTELWDLSLVDPDNRRPVDHDQRASLRGVLGGDPRVEDILARNDEGLPKLHVLRSALHVRRRTPAAFGPTGAYTALEPTGSRAVHAVAFLRGEPARVAVVVPRLVLGLDGRWEDTAVELPAGLWRNRLTGDDVEGGTVQLAELLARFPVALLSREEDG